MVDDLNARLRIVVDGLRTLLIRQKGLNKRKRKNRNDDDQEEHRHLVLEERTKRCLPVGIIGIAAALCIGFVCCCLCKQLLLRKLPVALVGSQLLLQIGCDGILQLFFFLSSNGHALEPSFFVKLILGSTSAMSTSPRRRPTTEMAA